MAVPGPRGAEGLPEAGDLSGRYYVEDTSKLSFVLISDENEAEQERSLWYVDAQRTRYVD